MRPLSLTARLTLLFTAVAAAVVLGLGWLFWRASDAHFQELDRTALEDKAHLIDSVLDRSVSADDARQRLHETLSHHRGLRVVIRDASGQSIFQTLESTSVGHVHDRVAQTASTQDAAAFHELHYAVAPAFDPGNRYTVQLGVTTQHHQQFLADLRVTLVWYALGATGIMGVLGWLAARQGLAPLRAMRRRAADVTAQRLQERMPVAAVPIEMAELASELNEMLDRLQEDFRRLSDFASDLAHELRTPISNLLTQTQVSLSAVRDGATYRDILASNAEELQRLARMVSDMLFLAKTERGVDLPHKERFDVAREAHALVDFYDALAQEKSITLAVQGAGDVVGDRLMVRRALSNLLSNALRHTPAGGAVTIRIGQAPGATDVVVENTGDAISERDLPRLFDRFYRADPARAHPDTDGAGLGLAITKAIAQAHGGSVVVTSQPGCTRFQLRIAEPLASNVLQKV